MTEEAILPPVAMVDHMKLAVEYQQLALQIERQKSVIEVLKSHLANQYEAIAGTSVDLVNAHNLIETQRNIIQDLKRSLEGKSIE